jgi:hypothetical protein
MNSTTYPYHVVLASKTKHKKKGKESGINYPGELTTLNSHGDTKYLLGTVVELFRFNLQI